MLKKLMLLLCLGAFIAVAALGGCKKEEPKPEDEKPPVEKDDTE